MVVFYRVSSNAEFANAAPRGATGLSSYELPVATFSSTDPNTTLSYVFLLKAILFNTYF